MCLTVSSFDPNEALHYQTRQLRFSRALASLSATEQNLLYLRYYQQVPVWQLAALYGLTRPALNRRLRRLWTKLESAELGQRPA